MSKDFLKEYTIPLLQSDADPTQELQTDKPVQPDQTTPLLTAPNLIRNYEPSKEPGSAPSTPPKRPQKRKLESLSEASNHQYFIGRDASYPEGLMKLIQPLRCNLCSVQINSLKSAKDHYQSKAHDKKLTAWIAHNYPENPPAIKRFVYEPSEGEGGSDALHCKLCDLKLTSLTHAKQHYSGRKHKLVASNISNPKGAGFYDTEGKWVRTATKTTTVFSENDGRFGIGVDFKPVVANASTNVETNSKPTLTPPQLSATMQPDESLCCKICKISVTSAPQMKTHIEGARHRKNLARLSTDPKAEPVKPKSASESLLSIVLNSLATTKPGDDYSMYRTPSGSYYCQSCNMSMSSVATLEQHIQGKKHMKVVTEQKLSETKAAKTIN